MGIIGYEYDDGGRRAAGYKGDTGDCVVRAITIAHPHADYQDVYRSMADAMREAGYVASGNAYALHPRRNGPKPKKKALTVQYKVMESFGFQKVKLPRGTRPTFTEAYRRHGDCLISTTRHIAAIVGGVLRDTFDRRVYDWEISLCPTCSAREEFLAFPVTGLGQGNCDGCGVHGNIKCVTVERQRKAMSIWVRDLEPAPVEQVAVRALATATDHELVQGVLI